MEIRGIDVSRWQGDIDWSVVRNGGVEFAIIKAGGSDDGYYEDSKFERNYNLAKEAGIPIGAYYFVGPDFTSREDGIADAERFIELLEGKQFEYPCYLDLESTNPEDRDGVTEACIAFCERMESAGYYTGIYASDISGFQNRLNLGELTAFDKWVARYGSKPVYATSYGMWQYSSTERVSGIGGNVDVNISYVDYPTIIKSRGLNGFSSDPEIQNGDDEVLESEVEEDDNEDYVCSDDFEDDSSDESINVGDKVKVVSPINFDTGTTFGVYYDEYDVIEVGNDGRRIVIGIDGVVTSAIAIENLVKAGYESNYDSKKTCEEIADEIWIEGKWGDGQERIDNLRSAGYSDDEIQEIQEILNNK